MYEKYIDDIMKLYDMEQDENDELDKMGLPHELEEKKEQEIYERYDGLLRDLNRKYNIIFRYDLVDAWDTQISTLIITSEKENNVWCVYDNEDKTPELDTEYFTINPDFIKKILNDYKDRLLKVDEVEAPSMVDGVKSEFYFNFDGIQKELTANNLWTWYEDIPDNVKVLLDIYNEIYEALEQDNKNIKRCLFLGE